MHHVQVDHYVTVCFLQCCCKIYTIYPAFFLFYNAIKMFKTIYISSFCILKFLNILVKFLSCIILCFVDRTTWYNLVNRTSLMHNFLNMFIAFLYVFRATMCPSSGENTVPMRHLAFFTLYRRLSGMQDGIPPCIPNSHLYRVTNTRCRIGTVFSSDDGHIVARNM